MYYNINFSPTGGTKEIADLLMTGISKEYKEIDICNDIDSIIFHKEDICLFSVPSYGGRVPSIAIERIKKLSANKTKAVLNCVYGNRHFDDTLSELQDVLEEQGFICVAAVAAVARHSLFNEFACDRPDESDKKQLEIFAEKIYHKLNESAYIHLNLPGSHDQYKEYNGSSLKPIVNDECIECGLCVGHCPVFAIDAQDPSLTNKDLCISCMHCVNLCPQNARVLDDTLYNQILEKIRPALSGRKENYIFL